MIENIKTFEDALQEVGTEQEKEFFANKEAQLLLTPDDIQYKELKVIIRAMNKDYVTGEIWVPDFNNRSQIKWVPVFAGVGFSYSNCACWAAYSGVCSRLCFVSEAVCDYFGATFGEKYRTFYLGDK